MKKVLFLFLTIALISELQAQSVKTVNYDSLEVYLQSDLEENKVQVVNFWASWCKPCVKELPYFLDLRQKYKHKQVSFKFVSLDFPSQIESQLIPFIKERSMTEDVFLLDDSNSNRWINLVDPSWSGAIPATLIRTESEKSFHEKTFSSEEELDKIIQQFIQ